MNLRKSIDKCLYSLGPGKMNKGTKIGLVVIRIS